MSRTYTCRMGCPNTTFPTYKLLNEHKKQVHGVTKIGGRKDITTLSPLDQIHAAEHQILEAVKGLEAERDRLHNRIVEIDNMVAKYRKWTSSTNGHGL